NSLSRRVSPLTEYQIHMNEYCVIKINNYKFLELIINRILSGNISHSLCPVADNFVS
ncbi:hypothetical protein C922_05513, partial [Plasmodium inui San Antonio 1]